MKKRYIACPLLRDCEALVIWVSETATMTVSCVCLCFLRGTVEVLWPVRTQQYGSWLVRPAGALAVLWGTSLAFTLALHSHLAGSANRWRSVYDKLCNVLGPATLQWPDLQRFGLWRTWDLHCSRFTVLSACFCRTHTTEFRILKNPTYRYIHTKVGCIMACQPIMMHYKIVSM